MNPLVSLVLPIRNEATHLERALDAIDAQTYPRDRIEIIVVDGGSTDATVSILHRRMTGDPRLSLLGGQGVNTPMAMRIGAEAARGDVIVKVDGHGWMNERFVEVAVASLASDPSLGCVGGLIDPIAITEVQRANAIARFSRFGVGGGIYTMDQHVQDADTVQCGAYRREALDLTGGFDPAMAYGEDEELNHRIRQAGWRIQLHPAMRYAYHVRPTVGALFRQYFRYGRARVAVVRKHPSFFRPKHTVPAMMVAGLASTLLLAPFRSWQMLTAVAWGSYLAFIVAGAVSLSMRHRFWRPELLAASLAALHFGYGCGFLRGLADRPSDSRTKRDRTPTA